MTPGEKAIELARWTLEQVQAQVPKTTHERAIKVINLRQLREYLGQAQAAS